MVVLPISLGGNHSLREEDLFRALFCSVGVYFDNVRSQNYFQEALLHFPHITFDKVDMSLDVYAGQKILVAYSGNDVFIAFRGTDSLNDVASDVMETCRESLFSIAFGAPHICNHKAAELINNNDNLRWRFINFVNQSDPVPCMLHRIGRTISAGLRGSFVEADGALQAMGGFVGRCMKGFSEGGLKGGLNSTVREAGRIAGKALVSVVQQKILPFGDALLASVNPNSSSSEVPRKPDFHPIGQYIALVQEDGDWTFDKYFGDDLSLQAFLDKDLKFTGENLKQHTMASYKSTISAIFGSSAPGDVISSMPHQSPQLRLVRTPAPKVTFAEWIIVDLVPQYIKVRGENLLFLREAVSVNGLEHWTIHEQSDKQFILCRPPKSRVLSQELNISDKAVYHIIIKTAFGQTHHPILEDSRIKTTTDIGVSRMICKIVQVLNVKATPPLSIRPKVKVLDSLNDLMHCVPELKGKKISTELLEVTKCGCDLTVSSLEKHCREINYMLERVGNYLKSSLKVEYFKSERLADFQIRAHSRLVESGLVKAGIIMGGLGAVLLPAELLFGAPIAVTMLVTCLAGKLILTPKELILTDYEDVLKCAIEETSQWSALEQTRASTNSERNLEDLEKELVEEVKRSSRSFKKMVKEAHSTSIDTVPRLQSDLFRFATPESRLKLLKRIKLVYDSTCLYNSEVAGVHFMGIFGAEDAGKSTFIKKVLKQQFPRDEHLQVPHAGFDSHTEIVRPYKLNDSLWLVDFPGSNGAGPYADKWKQFTSLSSSSVLFLNFEYDVKKEQVQMYQEMKTNLGSRTTVTIVFNKVDERFTPRKKAIFSTEYFRHLKQETEIQFGCKDSKDTVHFACVDPDVSRQDLAELKGMGVLGFEELHDHLVTRFMTQPSTSG